MKHRIVNLVILICTVLVSLPSILSADTIFLKDGSIEKSRKVWTSDKFVHFILNGTQGVEIRIAKEIVEKVVHDDGSPSWTISSDQREEDIQPTPKKPEGPKAHDNIETSRDVDDVFPSKKERTAFLAANRGKPFYDPRRQKRYWAQVNARFSTLNQALHALAEQYHRPIEWIEANMGEENDIAAIHQKLCERLADETLPQKDSGKPESAHVEKEKRNDPDVVGGGNEVLEKKASGIQFYNPRRDLKYWSSPTAHHHTLDEAIEALAHQYNKRPEWIEEHMGATNELDLIHRFIQEGLRQEQR